MVRKYICPACHAKAGVNIVYGYPGAELMEASERGEVALGGCCVSDNDPERRCLQCDHEWHIKRRSKDFDVLINYLEDCLINTSVDYPDAYHHGFSDGFRSAIQSVMHFYNQQEKK